MHTAPPIDTSFTPLMNLPSPSITNKPSNGTSLYHTCRSVLEKLAAVPDMQTHINAEEPNDPLNRLWTICRRGLPLVTLFNALNPNDSLSLKPVCTQLNDRKKCVYHFIVACRNELELKEEDLFTLSDVYKDNTNGFVKVKKMYN
ncbi:unnamed protein product [Rhizopus stolonifer]